VIVEILNQVKAMGLEDRFCTLDFSQLLIQDINNKAREDQTPDINMSYRRNLKFNAYTLWRVAVAYIFKLADLEPDCITYKSDSLAFAVCKALTII